MCAIDEDADIPQRHIHGIDQITVVTGGGLIPPKSWASIQIFFGYAVNFVTHKQRTPGNFCRTSAKVLGHIEKPVGKGKSPEIYQHQFFCEKM